MRPWLPILWCTLVVSACEGPSTVTSPTATDTLTPPATLESPLAGDAKLPPSPDGPGRVRVLVRFGPAADRNAIITWLGKVARVTYRYRLLPDLIAVRDLPLGALSSLEARPGVTVEHDGRVHTNLAESRALIHATNAALPGHSDGAGVRVCVVDSGINQTHPAFSGAVAAQRDFVDDDAIAQDTNGHGSNVAGIVAARGAQPGVAPGASLLVARVLDGSGSGFHADVIAGIEWCTLDAAGQVLNLSLGGTTFLGTCDDEVMAEAVNASVDHGVVNVVAAGNDGLNGLGTPACARRAIVVGATYDGPQPEQRWCLTAGCGRSCTDTNIIADKRVCFSNTSVRVDVMAPGSAILAPGHIGSGNASLSGTSQATPHVAGLIARLLGDRPELRPNHVRRWLQGNALDLGTPGFDLAFAHGRIDAVTTLADTRAVTCSGEGLVAACDDGDPCTHDLCEAGFCVRRARCDDGAGATLDTCDAGRCTHTAAVVDDARACTTDSLDACLGPLHAPANAACHSSCATAVPLPIGVSMTGTTVGASRSIATTCTGSNAVGGNVVYRMDLDPAQPVSVAVAPTSAWSPAIYLLASSSAGSCDVGGCVAGANAGGSGVTETLTNLRVPVAGTYYLVVDATTTASSGTFTITTTATCDPEDEGLPCDDGNACTGADVCAAGVCVGGAPPPACRVDDDCVDGDLCNGDERCSDGICTPGTTLVCDDGDGCTNDACDPLTGCTTTPAANGTSCSDGDRCNGVETCQGGTCRAGDALSCNDRNACTSDTCDPVAGCTFAPQAGACDDGDACTSDDACVAGVCAGVERCTADQLVMSPAITTDFGSFSADDEDLVRYDPSDASYHMYFDGSDLGLARAAINAFAYSPGGELVFAFAASVDVPGLVGGPSGQRVEPRDLVRFTATTLGEDTAGTFTFLFDGSDVGLTMNAETFDALAFLADGSIIVSPSQSASVVNASVLQHDLLRFVPMSLGAQTTGTWAVYFDGSDVGLTSPLENITGISLFDGALLVTTAGPTTVVVAGHSVTTSGLLRFVPTAFGPHTVGTWSVFRADVAGMRGVEWRRLPVSPAATAPGSP